MLCVVSLALPIMLCGLMLSVLYIQGPHRGGINMYMYLQVSSYAACKDFIICREFHMHLAITRMHLQWNLFNIVVTLGTQPVGEVASGTCI